MKISFITVAAIAAVSAAALAVAFIAQYGFGLLPCELCIWQRLPWAGTLGLGLLALNPFVAPEARRQVVALCAALFAANAALAAYHAGVEYHWWQGPTACTGGVRKFDLNSLAAALEHPGIVACDQPAIRVFGISMAGADALACFILALACLWAVGRRDVWRNP